LNGRDVCLVECCFREIYPRQCRHRSNCDHREQSRPKSSRHLKTPIAPNAMLGLRDCQPKKREKAGGRVCELGQKLVLYRSHLSRRVAHEPTPSSSAFASISCLSIMPEERDSGGELTVKSQLQDGQLQFSVSDTGPGLPAGSVDQIFSAFFTTKPQGSGMGLAISRPMVESHGGRLWTTANERGATFHFSLPRSDNWAQSHSLRGG
jgi:hypothetical protein